MTAEILLREVCEADLPIFFEHQADPLANQMAAFPPRDRQSFFAHWAKIKTDPNVVIRTILADGQVAGNVVSFVVSTRREVGYWLGRAYWGKGIATRALAQFLGINAARPLFAYVAKHNLGSLRVLQKCGFVIVGEDSQVSGTGNQPVKEFILKLDPAALALNKY